MCDIYFTENDIIHTAFAHREAEHLLKLRWEESHSPDEKYPHKLMWKKWWISWLLTLCVYVLSFFWNLLWLIKYCRSWTSKSWLLSRSNSYTKTCQICNFFKWINDWEAWGTKWGSFIAVLISSLRLHYTYSSLHYIDLLFIEIPLL